MGECKLLTWEEDEALRRCTEESSCESDTDCDNDLPSHTNVSGEYRCIWIPQPTSSGVIPPRPPDGKKAVALLCSLESLPDVCCSGLSSEIGEIRNVLQRVILLTALPQLLSGSLI